jgi:hypothetical protein
MVDSKTVSIKRSGHQIHEGHPGPSGLDGRTGLQVAADAPSTPWWGTDHDDRRRATFRTGQPCVVDSHHQDTVSRSEMVRTVVQENIHVAEDDGVEVDGVGVVPTRSLSRLELDEYPSCNSGRNL